MKNRVQYKVLADLFRYPMEDYVENVNQCAAFLKDNYPKAYADLLPFIDWANHLSLYEIEEVFGKTFHIQAVCYLDLGYVLFGEDYKRGEFLVQMKNEQRKANNDCGDELADNLPNVLTLMSILEDEEFLSEFSVRIVIPAMQKMIEEFDQARMELKDKVRRKKQKVVILEDLMNKNIYQYALQAILEVVRTDFKGIYYNDPVIVPTLSNNVLNGSCGTACSTTGNTTLNTK